jgi:hypothetical protein
MKLVQKFKLALKKHFSSTKKIKVYNYPASTYSGYYE